MNESELFTEISKLNFEQKQKLFTKFFTTGYQSDRKLDTKLELIKLICFVTSKMRQQDKAITPKIVIERITNKQLDNPALGVQTYLAGLAIACEDFLYEVDDIKVDGFKNSQEIIARIREILDGWFPF